MSDSVSPPANPQEPERIRDLNIERELQDSYLTYAMSTIMDRALPDVRDGLKPSQRRILIAMNDLNLTPGRKQIKCAKICGDTSGNYHPHGESVIYPTLVRMGQDWNMRAPLVDPQGNFGSNDNDPPAAMRYTEARMTAVTVELMSDLEEDTVDFVPNYDERLMEPTVLPAKFPNLLVNGSTGIAVGMACNLVPHNVNEICDAIVATINKPDISLAELMQHVKGPDFPTGGIIRGVDGIIDGYRAGRGKMTLQAKVDIEEDKSRSKLIISEMPYGGVRENLVKEIVEKAKNGDMPDVSGVNDESGRLHKVRIVIDLKRDADAEIVKRQLYQFTGAQVTVSMINIALHNRQPRTMGLKELITHFIAHRQEVIVRRTRFRLKKAQQRAHILEGQIMAVCDIDEVVKLIRSSRTREEAMDKLRAKAFRIALDHPLAPQIPSRLLERPGMRDRGVFLSQAQADAIAALRLIQLVGLEIEKLANEYREVVEEIEGYERILADPELVLDIIREDTIEIKEKFGTPRRTQIEGDVSAYNYESLITPHDVVVTLTHKGYIKRLPTDTYRSQGRGGRGVKGNETREEDFVDHLFVANTHDHLLIFTNKGRVYAQRVFDVPEGSRTSLGRSIANMLEFQEGEKLAQVLTIKDFNKEESFLMFATQKGTVKKTALSAYANINRRGIIAIGLDEDDTLIEVALSSGKDHILLATASGLAIRFEEEEVRAMGRTAGGVTGARFKREGDSVVSMVVIPLGDNDSFSLLTACENGYGKRSALSEYPVKGRGTRGVNDIDTEERNGDVVGVKLVSETDELMMITQNGILIRTRAADVSVIGRNTKGVRLLRLDEGDKLVAVAKVEKDEGDENGEAAAESPTEPQT